jgi:putative acetyltransferase
MDDTAPVLIREEQLRDGPDVRRVNEAAFGCADEADLIDRLLEERVVLLSVVAEVDGQLIGHVLFSRLTVDTAQGALAAVALAPMAVLPSHQGLGVGSKMVHHGLDKLRERGEGIVIVLGHKKYYPRFGFSSEKASSLTSPFPPEFFMALELTQDALAGIQGAVRYPSAFGL